VVLLLYSLIQSKAAELTKDRQAVAAARTAPTVPVTVHEVEPVTVVDRIRLPGMIEALNRVEVAAQVAGKVEALPVGEGGTVRKGDVLVRIETDDYRIAVERAEATLALAEKTIERTRRLVEQDIRTPEELEADENALAQARNALAQARLNLERTEIRSPIDGIVDEVMPETGELISLGMPVALVVQTDPLKVEVAIPEKDVSYVRNLEEAEVEIDAVRGGMTVTGRRTYLSFAPMRESLVYILRLQIPNPDGTLRPGMFAEAQVVREVRRGSMMVPLFAVLPFGDEHIVYVVGEEAPPEETNAPAPGPEGNPDGETGNDGQEGDSPGGPGETVAAPPPAPRHYARRRRVTLGVLQGRSVEILSGLAPGERLILQGQHQVEDGSLIRVMQEVDSLEELRR
jgi:membrane fusion protein (multidrug efflux system)